MDLKRHLWQLFRRIGEDGFEGVDLGSCNRAIGFRKLRREHDGRHRIRTAPRGRGGAIKQNISLLFGSGPIKGFAVVLSIGIATSVFTAVTIVRWMVARWLTNARPATLSI